MCLKKINLTWFHVQLVLVKCKEIMIYMKYLAKEATKLKPCSQNYRRRNLFLRFLRILILLLLDVHDLMGPVPLYSRMVWANTVSQYPIGSMYGIFTYIWWISMVNVGKYTSPMDTMGTGTSIIIPKVPWNHRIGHRISLEVLDRYLVFMVISLSWSLLGGIPHPRCQWNNNT